MNASKIYIRQEIYVKNTNILWVERLDEKSDKQTEYIQRMSS